MILNTPAGTTIMSAPGVVLALVIASRSENLPLAGVTSSRVVFTVKVEGTSRASRHSSPRCTRDRKAGLCSRLMRRCTIGVIQVCGLGQCNFR